MSFTEVRELLEGQCTETMKKTTVNYLTTFKNINYLHRKKTTFQRRLLEKRQMMLDLPPEEFKDSVCLIYSKNWTHITATDRIMSVFAMILPFYQIFQSLQKLLPKGNL